MCAVGASVCGSSGFRSHPHAYFELPQTAASGPGADGSHREKVIGDVLQEREKGASAPSLRQSPAIASGPWTSDS